MTINGLIHILKRDLNINSFKKDLVFYSNDKELLSYDFIGIYENKGQIEIHLKEGEKLENSG